ncbi:PAS domain S-box protein, partial [Candidatus Pacearchaeota archaeon]|nr:PAS domain S-box protein [Candidatus Pacearchaeota archaeon]
MDELSYDMKKNESAEGMTPPSEKDDTEEVKALKKKLMATERDLRSILDNMPDMFFRTNIEGKILIISPAVKNIQGYEPD